MPSLILNEDPLCYVAGMLIGIRKCIVLALFLAAGSSTADEKAADLTITEAWKPAHPQAGKTVTVNVRILKEYLKHISNPYQAPLSGELLYGNKGVVLNPKGKDSPLKIYIKSSQPLPDGAKQRITGRLDVSTYQIKGGTYPATLWLGNAGTKKAPEAPAEKKPGKKTGNSER